MKGLDARLHEGAAERTERALKSVHSCGELSNRQLAEVLKVPLPIATALMQKLRATGRVEESRRSGRTIFFKVTGARAMGDAPGAAPKGFATLPPGIRRSRVVKAGCKGPEKVDARTPLPPPPAPDLAPVRMGIFSDGHIVIEADGTELRLSGPRARKLIDWLIKLDTHMKEAFDA